MRPYSNGLASREAAKVKLLGDLKAAMIAAHAEFSNLLRVEHSRRHDTLAKRIVAAGRLMEDHHLSGPMDLLLSRSELIEEVRRAEIPHQAILILEGPISLRGCANGF
jgi:hypothetical protein